MQLLLNYVKLKIMDNLPQTFLKQASTLSRPLSMTSARRFKKSIAIIILLQQRDRTCFANPTSHLPKAVYDAFLTETIIIGRIFFFRQTTC